VIEQFVLLQAHLEDLTSTISQLRDENMVLRAQTNAGLGQATDASTLGHNAFHLTEAHQHKTENELQDSLSCKLVSTAELTLVQGFAQHGANVTMSCCNKARLIILGL
jgi:hypothetical protein